MATPPRPSSAEIEAALDRIRARHERLDDPRRSEMGTSPRDVLAYLQRRSPALPRALRTDDAWDELILSAALHWEELARQRGLLRRARGLGVSLSELAAHFGISTRQGMQARLDRLEALVKVGSPDVDLTRRARRADKGRAGDQRWLDAHHGEINPLLRDLLAQVDRTLPPLHVGATDHDEADHRHGDAPDRDDEASLEWLDELRADVDAGAVTPATMGILGLVLGELRTRSEVAVLDRSHGLHRALRRVERLRATWEHARGSISSR